MNRLSSLLALGAIVVAGAFAGTAAQASANVSIAFTVQDADSSASMTLTAKSGNISGLTTPPAAILAGNYDPGSGSALFSAPTPVNTGDYAEGFVRYANAGNTSNNVCTFYMRVTRLGLHSFKAHFWINEIATPCSVPSDAINSDGAFTGTTYTLVWKT